VKPDVAIVTTVSTTTASARAVQRSQKRRRRQVERHPGVANLGDVEQRLAQELGAGQVDFVLDLVGRHRIDSATLWAWLDAYGADALLLALASGHGYAWLLRQLRAATAPDTTELAVLAFLSQPDLFAEDMSRTRSGLIPR